MTIHAVLYSTPNCQKCRMTNDRLSKVMRVKHEQLFNGNDETGERIADWCDFRVDQISKYVKMAEVMS